MILVTSDEIPGKRINKVLGMVKGNTIRARHVGHDFMAGIKNLVGGEISHYTKMMAETREQALDRMMAEAESLGANAIVCVRFATTQMMQGAAEFLVYGTAILCEDN